MYLPSSSSWWPRGNVGKVERFTRRDEGALGGATAFVSLEAKPDERLGVLPDCSLEIWGRSGPATVVFLGGDWVRRSGHTLRVGSAFLRFYSLRPCFLTAFRPIFDPCRPLRPRRDVGICTWCDN
jgi:hypothetical protein